VSGPFAMRVFRGERIFPRLGVAGESNANVAIGQGAGWALGPLRVRAQPRPRQVEQVDHFAGPERDAKRGARATGGAEGKEGEYPEREGHEKGGGRLQGRAAS
jgi:hypothetical protein